MLLFADHTAISWTEYGIVGTILIFIGYCIMWAGRQLLGRDGILPKVADRHIKFVGSIEDAVIKNAATHEALLNAQQDQVNVSQQINGNLDALLDHHSDPNNPANNCRLQSAMLVTLDIFEKFADKLQIDINPELIQLRTKLAP